MGIKTLGFLIALIGRKRYHKDSLKKIFDNFKSEVYNISFQKNIDDFL